MKKNLKIEQDMPNIAELIIKMQQQLSFLEKKIDTLIGQTPEKSFNTQPPKPFQRFDHPHHRGAGRQDNNFRERVLHKAICADCKKECEVPFKPSGERPVYCKDCFSKRKGGGSFNERPDNRHRQQRRDETSYDARPHGGEKKRFPGKKHTSSKRRKTRA